MNAIHSSIYLLLILAGISLIGCAQPVNPAEKHPASAVVRVSGGQGVTAEGCGFLISPDGMLVTASSLIGDGTNARITLSDGRGFDATFIEEDREAGVAIMKIAGEKYPFLHLHGDDLEPIMHIRMISPNGVTHGVFDRWENSGALIGFTARVSPADAGAPLVSDKGEVIGVVREPAPATSAVQLATPIWHVTRMLPSDVK